MNKILDDAITRLRELPDERQQQAAALLLDFLESDEDAYELTPEQLEEIDRCLSDDEPFATEEEVKAFFDRFRKPAK